jgi:hypothetical protein
MITGGHVVTRTTTHGNAHEVTAAERGENAGGCLSRRIAEKGALSLWVCSQAV